MPVPKRQLLLRVLCPILLAASAAFPVGAHQVNPVSVSLPTLATSAVTATGSVAELVVNDQVSDVTLRYLALRLDDGQTLALTGAGLDSLSNGTRVEATGSLTGTTLAVTSFSVLRAAQIVSKAGVTAQSRRQVQGTLAIHHKDYFAEGRGEYGLAVASSAGQMTPLNVAVIPDAVRPGMTVSASGTTAADGVSLDTSQITILGLPPAQTTDIAAAPITNNVLVMPIKFSDSAAGDPFTPSQVDQVMRTNAGSVAAYYNEVSYGQQLLNITVACNTTVPGGCAAHTSPGGWLLSTSPTPASCDFTTIGSLADAAATAAGYNLANYKNRFYVFPSNGSCGWAGLAYIGYPYQAWSNAYNALWVYGHELGHNFTLYHAGSLNCSPQAIGGSCSAAEYGDRFDIMGNNSAQGQQMHFNAAQKSILNWIPVSSVVTHTVGTATYTLSPLESAGQSTYAVKIPVTANANRTYWIEYRQPIGFDSGIAAFPNNGAQIRVAYPFEVSSGADDTEILDMTPGTAGNFYDAALLAGQSYTDSTYGISVTVNSATASALTLTVSMGGKAATTTALASSANPSMVGANVTFTATVTGSAPTGTVGFTSDGSTISGCSAVSLPAGSANSKTATCSTSNLSTGSHSIVATYTGDAANNGSTSPALSQVVNSSSRTASTTSLASSANPSLFGASVTFTATVGGSAPTGTVAFAESGSALIGCAAVALSGAQAVCNISSLSVGSHNIVATYSGDANNLGSFNSPALAQVVNSSRTASTTSLASSANPSVFGANVTFTATVSGSVPTGSVGFTSDGTTLIGCAAVALSSAQAACNVSTLSVGSHNIVATYSGDANNLGSFNSPALVQVVSATGSINVALASNGGVASASSTFGAGYSPSFTIDNIRTGANWGISGGWNDATPNAVPDWLQVNFSAAQSINRVVVYSVQDDYQNPVEPTDTMTFTLYGLVDFTVQGWNGTAWVTLGTVTGNNLVKRTVLFPAYTTDRIRIYITTAPNTWSRLTEVEAWSVGGSPSPTTTSLASAPNPSVVGANVTFTATVSGNAPTGTVAFAEGGSALSGCAAVALSGGQAVCNSSSLSVGSHNIVATYSGDANNLSSFNSPALAQVVNNKTASTTALASSANPSIVGANVTFTATVTGSTPTGSVGFTSDGTTLSGCAAVALSGGQAVCNSSSLSVGSHNIVATYSGDANNLSSFNSPALAQVVNNKTASTTALASSANPSIVGANVMFTATVTGSAPTGSVGFTSDGTTLSGCAVVALPAGSANSKTATCSTASLSAATHSIVATYTGDAANSGSTSTALSQMVNSSSKTASTTSLASSADPSVFGANVTFTATVSGSVPTGSVGFTSDGTTLIGCAAVALSSAQAACNISTLSVGSHNIVATYSGDANNLGSFNSPALVQVVSATGSINVALASNGGVASASSTFGTGYSPSFTIDNIRTGANWGISGGWNDATPNAVPDWLQVNFSAAQSINRVVVYSVQDDYQNPVEPTDTMTFTLYGLVDFTVQGWNGTAWVTLGTVTGNNLVKRTVLFPAYTTDRIRIYITTAPNTWSRLTEVEAWSVGGSPSPTTTSLASAPNPSVVGANVTFTATVSGNAPTGSVGFTSDGTTLSGCAAVALSGGQAVCNISSLSVGSHNIVATYSGDANNLSSFNSPALAQVVNNKTASTTALASSANPSIVGANVTFTATVTGSTPTGSVGFTSDGTTLSGCAVVALPTGSANSKTATCSTASLSAATHSIVAAYTGDAANNGSTSTALSQVVNNSRTASTTSLASSANPSVFGANVTFTATVSGSVPTGSVGFTSDGTTLIGCAAVALSSAQAACNVSTLSVGSHNIVATYSGDAANSGSTSSPLAQVVNSKTATTTGLSSSANPSVFGANVTFSATVSGSAPTGSVGFTADGTTLSGCAAVALPAGSANTKTATCSAAGLAAGTHSIVATYSGDVANNGSTSTTLSQVVNKAASTATVASSPNPSTSGASVTFTATVTGVAPTGSVSFKDGAISIAGCSAVSFTGGTINATTATCSTSSLTQGTHSIAATYSGDTANNGSTSSPLAQAVNPVGQINVALASNGGLASVSSSFNAAYGPAGLNDGERAGLNWGNNGGWNDATPNSFPDWAQITFNGSKTIDHVVVYTVQDNYTNPVQPTDTLTFTQWGVTDFTVQGWNGAAWVSLGSVAGNNLIKRTVNFAAYTTDRIRINITHGLGGYSRLTEIEAWGN